MKAQCNLNNPSRGGQSARSHLIPSDPQAPYYNFELLFLRQGSVLGLVSPQDLEAALEETDIYVLLCSSDRQYPSTSCRIVHFLGRLIGYSDEFGGPDHHAARTLSAVLISRPGQYGTSFEGVGSVVTWNWLVAIAGWQKLVIRPSYDKLFLTPDASLPGPNVTSWSIHETSPFMLHKLKAIAQEDVWTTTQIDITSRAASKFAFTASTAYSDALVLNHLALTTNEGDMRVDVPLFSLLGVDSSAQTKKLLWSCLVKNPNMTTLAPAVMAMDAPDGASAIWDGTKFTSEYSGSLTFTALGAARSL